MITLDGIGLTLQRGRTAGIGVYFKELVLRAASTLPDVEVLIHDASVSARDLRCRPDQIRFRKPRLLERYRSLDGLPGGLVHSSYYRTACQPSVRTVITVYDFIYDQFAHGPRAFVHTTQKRRAIRRADAVICISHNTRADLLRLFPECSPKKVFVTHLAANEIFQPLKDLGPAVHPRPFVLFVSGRHAYKSFTNVVEAVKLAGELDLVCVGGGPFTDQERMLLDHALPGRHLHTGEISAMALNRLYNAAICLVYPSLYEGFGIPVVEAMSAGCPFVALNRSAIPEIAGNAGILLENPSPKNLLDAIDACTRGKRRAELRTRGLTRARVFSWDKTFRETAQIYDSILAMEQT